MDFTKLSEVSTAKKEDLKLFLANEPIKDIDSLKRTELVELAKNKISNGQVALDIIPEEDELETVVDQEEEELLSEQLIQVDTSETPSPDSETWTDYVLSMLHDYEKPNGKPRADGLRRIFPKIVGPIINTRVEVVGVAGPSNEGRATVVYTIEYLVNGHKYSRSDAADASYRNTQAPFSKHPTATAVTMAEGRCLRKVLGLNVILDEEALGEDKDPTNITFMQSNQSAIIQKMCHQLNIDIKKFFEHLDINTENFDSKEMTEFVTYDEALSMLRMLNQFHKDVNDANYLPIPVEISKNHEESDTNLPL